MKRQRAEISSNVISHIKSAHPIEMWRSNKLGIKEKISRGNFPRLIFSCPVPSGLPHRSHCVPMNMNPAVTGFCWSCWADSNCRPHPYQGCALPTELQQRVATTKGLEPSTSGVTGRRSNQLNYMAVYARCRVTSTQQINYSTYNACCKEFFLAGAERFELSTRGFGDRCSTS